MLCLYLKVLTRINLVIAVIDATLKILSIPLLFCNTAMQQIVNIKLVSNLCFNILLGSRILSAIITCHSLAVNIPNLIKLFFVKIS